MSFGKQSWNFIVLVFQQLFFGMLVFSHHIGIKLYFFFIILQLVRSNSRRFMPSQADDEAHQLSYLQKHLANIISLLAEPVEGEGEESLVCASLSLFSRELFLQPDNKI